MTSLPIEIAARMAVVGQWMDVARFAALKAAVDAKMGREHRETEAIAQQRNAA